MRPILHHCAICGEPVESVSYGEPYKSRMVDRKWCFSCVCWENRSKELDDTRNVVIGSVLYTLGPRTSPSSMNGMSGRWFRIVRQDGTIVDTCDLWCGGDIPKQRQRLFPDNATFGEGCGAAKRPDTGEVYAFNSLTKKPDPVVQGAPA